jgi:hypothetical protein
MEIIVLLIFIGIYRLLATAKTNAECNEFKEDMDRKNKEAKQREAELKSMITYSDRNSRNL